VLETQGPPTDGAVLDHLQRIFGHTAFRPLQQDIVRSILGGQDVFVLMPTGGGKSLCYQLPALLLDGVTVVVSPLIALMKDQVDALRTRGISATFINSSLDSSEIGRRQGAVVRGDVRILYVAPERLMTPGFLKLLSSVNVALFAIDEAHCISEWGHDFRPEYRELTRLRDLSPSSTLAAFTATATARVQADIVSQLRLHDAARFRASFNRPNLFYEVRPKDNAFAELVHLLSEMGDGGSGIVYCLTRNGTEDVASGLRAKGFAAAAYHAGLTSEERRLRQEAFSAGDTRIIVATIAFGMGIDKPDVRFVVHYDAPKNLEGFYQESGRAGRDGEPSRCVLFYSYADIAKHEYFIAQKATDAEQRIARQQLRAVADWAESATCRRRRLLDYFDETLEETAASCCDVCREPPSLVDRTTQTQMFLSCVKRTGERFGSAYIVDVLRGSASERIRRFGHDRLSTYGIGRDRSKEEWTQLAHQLLHSGYVRRAAEEFNALKLTDQGNAVLFDRTQVLLPAPATRQQPASIARRARIAPTEANSAGGSPRISATAQRTLTLFGDGLGPEEIAERRALSVRTIEGHLAEAIETDEAIDIGRLVSPERQHAISAAIADVGGDLLKPIFERLGGAYTYGEIGYVRAALRGAATPSPSGGGQG